MGSCTTRHVTPRCWLSVVTRDFVTAREVREARARAKGRAAPTARVVVMLTRVIIFNVVVGDNLASHCYALGDVLPPTVPGTEVPDGPAVVGRTGDVDAPTGSKIPLLPSQQTVDFGFRNILRRLKANS